MKALRPVLLPVLAVTAVIAIAAGIFAGWEGVLGAVVGGLVVILFLGSTPVVLSPLVKASATLSLPVALGFFTTKAVAMLIVLLLLFDVGGIATHIDSRWFGIAAIAASLAWTLLQIRAFKRERVPTYDLGNSD
jgi:ATP synthase protein I